MKRRHPKKHEKAKEARNTKKAKEARNTQKRQKKRDKRRENDKKISETSVKCQKILIIKLITQHPIQPTKHQRFFESELIEKYMRRNVLTLE